MQSNKETWSKSDVVAALLETEGCVPNEELSEKLSDYEVKDRVVSACARLFSSHAQGHEISESGYFLAEVYRNWMLTGCIAKTGKTVFNDDVGSSADEK